MTLTKTSSACSSFGISTSSTSTLKGPLYLTALIFDAMMYNDQPGTDSDKACSWK